MLNILAGIAVLCAVLGAGFAAWEHNLSLVASNFSTAVWAVLYIMKGK